MIPLARKFAEMPDALRNQTGTATGSSRQRLIAVNARTALRKLMRFVSTAKFLKHLGKVRFSPLTQRPDPCDNGS